MGIKCQSEIYDMFLSYFGVYLKGNTAFSQEKHMYNYLLLQKN